MRPGRYVGLLAVMLACAERSGGGPDGAVTGADASRDAGETPMTLEARVLVISDDTTDERLGAIRDALEFQGTPYTVWIADDAPGALGAGALFDGKRGFYQGVILANGAPDTLTDPEWAALWAYEAAFGVRQATLVTMPTAAYGFGGATAHDTVEEPIAGELTAAGREVFPYLVGPLVIRDVIAQLALPLDAQTTPLIVDDAGHALVAIRTYEDGRQNLALTFKGNRTMVHTIALSYGVIHWVTRGVFVGERRIFATPQVDDVFLGNRLFGSDDVYRITGDDLRAVARWQASRGISLTLAFNGLGTTGTYEPDTLTPAAVELAAEFQWVSHSYGHTDLDVADYAITVDEIERNHAIARALGFGTYDARNLVTPEHSGLDNAEAMRAARDRGVRYLISNTSRPEQDNPFPNVGLPNALEPGLFQIPRHPTEIYFDVTTPDEEVVEYTSRHPDHDYGYEQILDKESDRLLRYMLLGDLDPWMFHQSNLRAYDGTHTLLTDVVDRTLDKYAAIYDLPVATLAMDALGAELEARTERHESGVTATIVPGESITLTVTRDATIAVTGVGTDDDVTYGGQSITHVHVTAGTPLTLPLR